MFEYVPKLVQLPKPTKLARALLAAGARCGARVTSARGRARNTNRQASLASGEKRTEKLDFSQPPRGLSWLCFADEHLQSLGRRCALSAAEQGPAAPRSEGSALQPLLRSSAPGMLHNNRARVSVSQTSGTAEEQGGLQMLLMLHTLGLGTNSSDEYIRGCQME